MSAKYKITITTTNKDKNKTILIFETEKDNWEDVIEEYLINFFETNGAKNIIVSSVYYLFESYWQEPYNETNPIDICFEHEDNMGNKKYVQIDEDYYNFVFDKYYKKKNLCSKFKCFYDSKFDCETCEKKYCLVHNNEITFCKSCKNKRCQIV